MAPHTDDLRIRKLEPLTPPAEVIAELPCDEAVSETVSRSREALHAILHGRDDRLAVVIGPCSIHDPIAAMEYAQRLRPLRDALGGELEIVMRVYFEKPRTTVGWKGLINDPGLDGSFRINEGLRLARGLLRNINRLGLPAGCEYLDTTSPHLHRRSGCLGRHRRAHHREPDPSRARLGPVVSGRLQERHRRKVKIAADAVNAASHPHHFLAVTKEGRSAIAATTGNPDCHVILRGGKAPNYDADSVEAASQVLAKAGLAPRLMIDASHANSLKDPENQPRVIEDIAAQIEAGETRIIGAMIESHLVAGRQDLVPGQALAYGQSITDGCIGWDARWPCWNAWPPPCAVAASATCRRPPSPHRGGPQERPGRDGD